MGINALAVQLGGAAVQRSGDEILNRFRDGGDDLEAFLDHQVIHDYIHKHGFDDQPEHRKQPGFHTESEAGGDGDNDIAAQKRHADIQGCILPQDHGDDVRSTGGSIQVEEDRRADRRKADGKHQLHQGLGSQRRFEGHQDLQQVQRAGHQQGSVGGTDAEGFAEDREADQQQENIDDGDKPAGGHAWNIVAEHNRDTGHAAGGKMIREFEEIDTGCQHQDAGCNQKPLPGNVFFRLLCHAFRFLQQNLIYGFLFYHGPGKMKTDSFFSLQ